MIDHNAPIAIYKTSFGFTDEQLTEMAILQDRANCAMFGPDWLSKSTSELPYFRATLIESVEAIQQMGYKWWKKTTCDMPELKMELVDILHFVLSDGIRQHLGVENFVSDVNNNMEAPTLYAVGRFANIETFSGYGFEMQVENPAVSIMTDINAMHFNDLCEQMIFSCLVDGVGNMNNMRLLFESVKMSPDEIYSQYVAKNVLNMFRNDNGQKEGSYYRLWNGKDDNEVLSKFLADSKSNNVNVNTKVINNFLAQTYATANLSHPA